MGTTILCLDDEPQGLTIRKAVLEQAGYTVHTATFPDEALRLFGTERIELVISDHLLHGTTGTRVALLMKLMNPKIPILILSGLTETPEGIEFADSFLCKLEPPPVLLATVARLLEGKKAAAA